LAQTRADISEEGRRFSAEFRESLASDRQQAIALGRHDLAFLTESSLGDLREEVRAQQARLAQAVAASGDQGINDYRKRLESASSSWLLTTVSKLDQQSQHLIDSIAQAAQERLRDACAQVFAEFGENLRQRILGTSAPSGAKGAAAGSP
jgi:histidinol dehydrogenase